MSDSISCVFENSRPQTGPAEVLKDTEDLKKMKRLEMTGGSTKKEFDDLKQALAEALKENEHLKTKLEMTVPSPPLVFTTDSSMVEVTRTQFLRDMSRFI